MENRTFVVIIFSDLHAVSDSERPYPADCCMQETLWPLPDDFLIQDSDQIKQILSHLKDHKWRKKIKFSAALCPSPHVIIITYSKYIQYIATLWQFYSTNRLVTMFPKNRDLSLACCFLCLFRYLVTSVHCVRIHSIMNVFSIVQMIFFLWLIVLKNKQIYFKQKYLAV